jgi:hypothetical protein
MKGGGGGNTFTGTVNIYLQYFHAANTHELLARLSWQWNPGLLFIPTLYIYDLLFRP